MQQRLRRSAVFVLASLATAILTSTSLSSDAKPATLEEARAFLDRANARLLDLGAKAERASWVQSTYITDDTELLAADARREQIAATLELAAEATRFDG